MVAVFCAAMRSQSAAAQKPRRYRQNASTCSIDLSSLVPMNHTADAQRRKFPYSKNDCGDYLIPALWANFGISANNKRFFFKCITHDLAGQLPVHSYCLSEYNSRCGKRCLRGRTRRTIAKNHNTEAMRVQRSEHGKEDYNEQSRATPIALTPHKPVFRPVLCRDYFSYSAC